MPCIDLGYEVVTDTVTVAYHNYTDQEVRVPYPTGKKPVGFGYHGNPGSLAHTGKDFQLLKASYPDDVNSEWVFVFNSYQSNLPVDVDYYVIFISV